MSTPLKALPLEDRIQLVEDLWDSIASDQNALKLSPEQRMELDRRLASFEASDSGVQSATDAIETIRNNL